MKITLFGATGRTGPYLIDEGLRRGFALRVFARAGRAFSDPRVQVVHGDMNDLSLVTDAICGSDAVLSALGPTSLRHPANTPIAQATRTIVSAMKQAGVSRLVAVSTGTAADPGDGFEWKVRLPAVFIRWLMNSAYRDMLGLAETIRACGLEWTMVRSAVLTDGPVSKRLNVGLYGHQRHTLTVSRADLAAFMFDQMGRTDFVGRAPGISTG